MRAILCALLIIALVLCTTAARDHSFRQRSTKTLVRASSSEAIFQTSTAYNNPDIDMEATQIQALIDAAAIDMPLATNWTQAELVDACRTPNSPTGILSCTDNGFPTVIALIATGDGSPSRHLGGLTELTILNLTLSPPFTGSLPVAWRTLTHLTTLYFGPDLALTGQIPEEWSEMTSLTSLAIPFDSSNILTSIPTWIGNLTTLRLQRANLEKRSLPNFLFTSQSLTTLTLENLRYDGNIPTELANNTILHNFYLSSFITATGSTLASDLSGMTSLKSFTLINHAVKSEFPSVWPSGLVSLTLESIYLMTGTIPQSLFDSPSLTSITLDSLNTVTGSFPGPSDPSLSNMESIQVGYLRGLDGTISSSWFWIPSLTKFTVEVTPAMQPYELGPLPTVGSGLCKLKTLDLSETRLSGSLPPALFSICPDLETVDLYKNLLIGPIPNDWSQSNGLVGTFYASNNRLTGSIPAGMKFKDSNDIELDFYENRLTGTLPADLFAHDWALIDIERNDVDLCAAGNVTIFSNIGYCGIKQRTSENFCPCATFWNDAGCYPGPCTTPSVGFPPVADFPPYTPATPLPPAFYPPPPAEPIEEPVSLPSVSPSPSTSPSNPSTPNIPGSPTLTPNTPTPTAATTPIAAASSITVSAALLVCLALIALVL